MLDKEYELLCTKGDKELVAAIDKMFSIYYVIKDKDIYYAKLSRSERMSVEDKLTLSLFLASLLENDTISTFFEKRNITSQKVATYLSIDLSSVKYLDKDKCKQLFLTNNKFFKKLIKSSELEDYDLLKLVTNIFDDCSYDNIMSSFLKNKSASKIKNDLVKLGKPSMEKEDKPFGSGEVLQKKDELLKYGEYLVPNSAVPRKKEIRKLEASLISPGSAILIGEAGVGKTTIVENLAYLIKNHEVPDVIKDKKVLKLDLPRVISKTKYRGDLENKLDKLISLLDTHEDLILFIDEIHLIMGAGSSEKNNIDVANFLKPYLSSGRVQVIGATTKEEYEKTILKDAAFRRRFNVITVDEPDKEMLTNILMKKKNNYEEYLGIKMTDSFEMIDMLTDLTSKEHRNYQDSISNPALAVNILGRAFAYAAIDEKKNINKAEFKEAILEEETIYQGVREDYARRLTTKSEKVKTKVITFPKK